MRARTGNTAVTVALSSSVLLAIGALVVDLSHARTVVAQLQNAADSAAHAGTAQLDRTAEGVTRARALATSIAYQHIAGGEPVQLAGEDIVTGVYDSAANTFTTSTNVEEINAVRVTARRPGLGLFFAPASVAPRRTLDLSADSTMTTIRSGASAVDCYLPLTLPACVVDQYTRDGLNEITLQLNPAPGDNVGYGRANGAVNAAWISDQVANCEASGTAAIGDPLTLGNGETVSALASIVDAVSYSSTFWSFDRWGTQPDRMDRSSIPSTNYGRTWEGAVLLFDGGPEYCTGGGSWNGTSVISGFVWGAVYDVRNTGSVHDRVLKMRLDTMDEHDMGTRGGGPDVGVLDYSPPKMVKPN